MRKSTLDLGTGTFVLLGFAALFFLTTQTTSRGLSFGSSPHYDLIAKFDNIGDLKVGAPVSMSGVEMGRVAKIGFDPKEFKAVVTLRMEARFNQIPSDSDASIYTQGLLGGKFVGLTAGGADTYLKDKDHIDFTQSAFVLENLIGQLVANFAKSSATSDAAAAPKADAAPKPDAAPKADAAAKSGTVPKGTAAVPMPKTETKP
jgi:phospholipid/cholesterol/gamma-HCH transport system substrate-binding protein